MDLYGIISNLTLPLRRFALFVLLLLTVSPTAFGQWHVTGLGGTFSRVEANRFNFEFFRSGPKSTTTPVIGAEGGRSIWKFTVDGTFLSTTTGQSLTFIGPALTATQTNSGHALLLDGAGEWPLLKIAGFRVLARVGYGGAWVHVPIPNELSIDDHRHFWTYGIVGNREIGSRFILRIDIRNIQFRNEEIPGTLGKFNVTALGGFGLRF